MITGDHAIIAKETARQLGLGTNIPDATGLPTLGEVREKLFLLVCSSPVCGSFARARGAC